MPFSTDEEELVEAFTRVENIKIEICYCSIYSECWTVNSKEPTPQPVRPCPDIGEAVFLR